MPKTPANFSISSGSPYVVPTGKYLIGRAFGTSNAATVKVDGSDIAVVGTATGSGNAGPVVVGAGSTLSTGVSMSYGVSGFLYDV